ncbi:hypothetical protein HSUHS5_0027 [Helicobacter suis HS5]|uniref:YhdP central domain-containing protein n=1 Tax=Helicobacter suis HS5 TaxID=710394 RepID=E7G299_9HELI|nr:hypothetical protein HSUHS5_0027 [Helicobacter suis HS5]
MIKIISGRVLRPFFSLIFVFVLLLITYITLRNGIYISSIHIGQIKLERLYLKLDNKFLLDIGMLDIAALIKPKAQRKTPSVEEIVQGIRYGIWTLDYFKRLSIQKIYINPTTTARIFFDGHQYEVSFPGIEGKFYLEERQKIYLKILQLDLAPYLRIAGNADYSSQTKQLTFNLQLSPLDHPSLRKSNLKFFMQGLTDFKTLALKCNSNAISHLDFLKPYIPAAHKVLRTWLFDNIRFSSFKIEDAKLSLNLKDKHLLNTLLAQLSAQAIVQNARVSFHENLPPILSSKVLLDFKDQVLMITPEYATYENMALEGSHVNISHFGSASKIVASIKIAPRASYPHVERLLKAYKILLPLKNMKSLIGADLLLTLQLVPHAHPLIFIQGSVGVGEGDFLLYGVPLFSQSANIFLDISPEGKTVYINTQHTRYHNMADIDARLTLDFKHKLLTSSATIHKIQINTNSKINMRVFSPYRTTINTHAPSLRLDILPDLIAQGQSSQAFQDKIRQTIKAQSQETFTKDAIYANQDNLPSLSFNLDFSKEHKTTFRIGELGIEGEMGKIYSLRVKNLAKLIPISPLARYFALKKGSLKISTKDFHNFQFFGINLNIDLPLYYHDGRPINSFSLLGTFRKDSAEIFSPDGAFMAKIQGGEKIVFINDINFNVDEFLNSKIPIIQELLAPSKHKPTKEQIRAEKIFIRAKQHYEKIHNILPTATIINATNTVLTFKSLPLALENLRLMIRDGQVSIDGSYQRAMLNLDMIHGNITLKASNFSGDYLNMALQSITSKDIIQGGLYNLVGGYKDRVFNGELRLQNTTIKNLKVLQKTVNVINTIPSLLAFRDPRLSANGYEIAKGKIIFGINAGYIGFEHIDLIGTTLDVDGSGILELSNRKLDMSLNLSTIKGFANVINKIPILNYLILGKNRKISTHVNLSGNLDNLNAKITLGKDIVRAPFKILRRIFAPIDIIISEIKKGMRNESPRVPKK